MCRECTYSKIVVKMFLNFCLRFKIIWFYLLIKELCVKDADKMANSVNPDHLILQYTVCPDISAEVLSDLKIAGLLRKNSSGHVTRFISKKSRNFEIPAIMAKNLWVCTKPQQIPATMTKNLWVCAKPQLCHLCSVKTNGYQLGAWLLVGLSG